MLQHNYKCNLAVRLSLPPPLTPPGSHSTVTPGLRTAAVVISSVGVTLPFPALVIVVCIFCYRKYNARCISDAKDWLEERRQKTKG